MASAAFAATSYEDFASALLERVCAWLPASQAVLLVQENGGLTLYAGRGLPGGGLRRAVAGPIVEDDPAWLRATLGLEKTLDIQTVPLSAASAPIGLLVIARPKHVSLSADDTALLHLVGERFSALAERQRRHHGERGASTAATAHAALLGNLADQEAFNRAIVETVVDGVLVIDHRGIVERFNPAAEKLFGYAADEVIGRNVNMLMPAPYSAEHDRYLANYLQSGQAKIIGIGRDVEGRRKDGSVFPLRLAVGEMRVGAERKFTGVVHDLTAERRLEDQARAERERLDLAAKGALDGLWEWNIVTGAEYFSDRWFELLGYAPGEVAQVYETWESSLHPDDKTGVLEAVQRHLQHRVPFDVEYRLRTKSGVYRWYHASGQAAWDATGTATRMAGSIRDVTEARRVETLMHEQATLARVGQMAAVVAHEVRNPLAAIRGVVEIIRTRFPEESTDRRVLGDLLTRVDALDALVTDLLVYTKPAAPKMASASIMALLRDSVALVGHDPACAGIRVEVTGDDVRLMVDSLQVSRAILNLLNNAVQAMRGQGTIVVSGRLEPSVYRIEIRDSGPGMPPEVLERSLEPFFTTKTRGTGLGLPIARQVVERHGGTLRIESHAGAGTSVTVELPASAPPQAGMAFA